MFMLKFLDLIVSPPGHSTPANIVTSEPQGFSIYNANDLALIFVMGLTFVLLVFVTFFAIEKIRNIRNVENE